MESVFLKLVNLSIAASWLVLAVMLVRLVFRQTPKWVLCMLWGLVALRLVCPISIESAWSLVPSAEPIPQEFIYTAAPQIQSGIAAVNDVVNPVLSAAMSPAPGDSANPAQIWSFILSRLWLAGAVLMLLYALVSWARLRRWVATATLLEKNIRQSERVDSPFVLGFFRPVIYLPYRISSEDAGYVIAHEQAHIQRKDHWWKPISFIILSVYWFNPFIWAAWVLLCRDIEAACDEKVIRQMGRADLRAYSTALLNCSVRHHPVAACPIAFGEVGVKQRVRHIMEYQQPAFWIVVIAVAACIVLALCFLTVPPKPAVSLGAVQISGASTLDMRTGERALDGTAPPLTQALAAQYIRDVLQSLTLRADSGIRFQIPETLPVSEDGKTKLSITLNATFAGEDGSYTVRRLLDAQTGWEAGSVYAAALPSDAGALTRLMLRAAFMTELGENTLQTYASDYVELNAPFGPNVSAVVSEGAVQVASDGQRTRLLYRLHSGESVLLSLEAPKELTFVQADSEANDAPAPLVSVLQGGKPVGTLWLHGLATRDETQLHAVNTAENRLPMPVFAGVALANHADYVNYTVRRAWETGACAVAEYTWQELSGHEGAAAGAPWLRADCILAYDWRIMPCFAQLLLDDGALDAAALTQLAGSLTLEAARW